MEWLNVMRIEAIKTHKVDISDSLAAILDGYIKSVCDEDIIIITSKIISILQGRLVSKETIDKRLLVQQEADLILKTERNPYDLYLTIRGGILIPSAGIDESNVDGYYVLYPEDIQGTAAWIWKYIKEQHNIQKLGVFNY